MVKVSNKKFLLPFLKFDHLFRLTDEVGIIEHCIFAIPDKNHGYTTDDNARALQASLKLNRHDQRLEKLTEVYLKFLIFAKNKNGFFNDLTPDLKWENRLSDSQGEHFGRAMNALGETAAIDTNINRKLCAAFLFNQMSTFITPSLGLRTVANLISGLYHLSVFSQKNPDLEERVTHYQKSQTPNTFELKTEINMEKTRLLANTLVKKAQENSDQKWHWFENKITYDNPKIPLALLYAYETTQQKRYLRIALETLDFLLENTFDFQKKCFSFVGHRGWFSKNGSKSLSGQQPIEAGGTVETCCFAYQVTGKKTYLDFAQKAFEWYSGRNINGLSLIDEESGGIKDGLEPYGINQNEGAESILSYLLAYHALETVKR